MRKIQNSILIGLSLILLSGCGAIKMPERQKSNIERQQDPVRDITYGGLTSETQKHSKEDLDRGAFGYVHYTRKEGPAYQLGPDHIPKLDSKQLADMITRLELSLPEVHDVGTLVTNNVVLVGYKTTNDNREQAAAQVKMTALSIVPNYYKVYVSDADDAIPLISRYKDLSHNTKNVNAWLQNMIDEMKQSPQGNLANPHQAETDMDQAEHKAPEMSQ